MLHYKNYCWSIFRQRRGYWRACSWWTTTLHPSQTPSWTVLLRTIYAPAATSNVLATQPNVQDGSSMDTHMQGPIPHGTPSYLHTSSCRRTCKIHTIIKHPTHTNHSTHLLLQEDDVESLWTRCASPGCTGAVTDPLSVWYRIGFHLLIVFSCAKKCLRLLVHLQHLHDLLKPHISFFLLNCFCCVPAPCPGTPQPDLNQVSTKYNQSLLHFFNT